MTVFDDLWTSCPPRETHGRSQVGTDRAGPNFRRHSVTNGASEEDHSGSVHATRVVIDSLQASRTGSLLGSCGVGGPQPGLAREILPACLQDGTRRRARRLPQRLLICGGSTALG
jgi:hypothetical protein